MTRALLFIIGLIALSLGGPAQAQNVNLNCINPDGSGMTAWAPCFLNNPSPIAGSGQYALAITSVQSLTVPASAIIAEICVEAAASRYTTTGTTPTSTVGMPVVPTATVPSCFQLAGLVAMQAFKIIGAGATIDVEYFK